jgi:hypothetical protein
MEFQAAKLAELVLSIVVEIWDKIWYFSGALQKDMEQFQLRDLTLALCAARTMPVLFTPGSLDLAHLRTALWFHEQDRLSRFVSLDEAQTLAAAEIACLFDPARRNFCLCFPSTLSNSIRESHPHGRITKRRLAATLQSGKHGSEFPAKNLFRRAAVSALGLGTSLGHLPAVVAALLGSPISSGEGAGNRQQ